MFVLPAGFCEPDEGHGQCDGGLDQFDALGVQNVHHVAWLRVCAAVRVLRSKVRAFTCLYTHSQ